MEKKSEMIRIRCRPRVKEVFYEYVRVNGFKTMEDALVELLKRAGWLVDKEFGM